MVRLLLIRHGVTEWNDAGRLMGRLPIGLAAHGRTQIERLATALSGVPLQAIYSSPQRRTQETAAILGAAHSLEVQTEEGLDEVWLAPRWQGRRFAELRDDPDLVALQADPAHRCDVIESIDLVQQRVVETADRLCANHADETIALVSHGDPLRVLLAHLLSIGLSNYRRLTVNTGSLTVIDRHRALPRLLLLGWKPGSTLETALSASGV